MSVQDRMTRPGVGIDLRHLYTSREATVWVGCALLAVTADLLLVMQGFAFSWLRVLLPMIALLFFDEQRRKRPGVGWLHSRPNGGWRLWAKVSLIVGGWALLLWFLLYGIASRVDWGPGFPSIDPKEVPWLLFPVCVLAPLIEEGVYRVLLCTALATRFRHRTVIIISGTLFALLHFTYGTLAPTNLLAGYLLSWAYLMSGSLWVPVIWHSAGNMGILAAGMVLFRLHAG